MAASLGAALMAVLATPRTRLDAGLKVALAFVFSVIAADSAIAMYGLLWP